MKHIFFFIQIVIMLVQYNRLLNWQLFNTWYPEKSYDTYFISASCWVLLISAILTEVVF